MLQLFRFFWLNALFGINGKIIMCFQKRDEVIMKDQILISIFLNYIESRFELHLNHHSQIIC